MQQNTQAAPRASGMPNWAYLFVAGGGGVVGHDYATFLAVEPMAGAAIGSVIAMIITAIFAYLAMDPDGYIKKIMSVGGALLGVYAGAQIAMNDTSGETNILVSVGICALIGAGLGQLVAGGIALLAITFLFLSQGPVGLIVRTYILQANG